MLEKSLGLLFFLKQPKNDKKQERYVYLRITVDGIGKELSTKRQWDLSRWDQAAGKAKGNKEDALMLNSYLESLKVNIFNCRSKLLLAGKTITAEALKNAVTGNDEDRKGLIDVFKKHNEQILALVGKDYAYRTYQRYRTTLDHTTAFILWKFNAADIDVKDLNYEFAKEYSFWLKTIKKCNHNSSMKYISTLKSVLLECKKKKWINDDPFSEFSTATKDVEIIPLNAEELQVIKTKEFDIPRLDLVKDIFVFCCYTGLAYVEVKNLEKSQVVMGFDGERWINTSRQKTGTPQRVPVLPVAREIIEKYKENSRSSNGYLLPVLSNQKMNSYLKEIADCCGIKKKLTFHLARHTFATTVTLSNGVPLETVSKMLGHKSIKQTQHYAKIVDFKISQDMAALKEKLALIK